MYPDSIASLEGAAGGLSGEKLGLIKPESVSGHSEDPKPLQALFIKADA